MLFHDRKIEEELLNGEIPAPASTLAQVYDNTVSFFISWRLVRLKHWRQLLKKCLFGKQTSGTWPRLESYFTCAKSAAAIVDFRKSRPNYRFTIQEGALKM